MRHLLTDAEVDDLLRYPLGRSERLAHRGILPCIKLPDGAVRFDAEVIERIMAGKPPIRGEDAA